MIYVRMLRNKFLFHGNPSNIFFVLFRKNLFCFAKTLLLFRNISILKPPSELLIKLFSCQNKVTYVRTYSNLSYVKFNCFLWVFGKTVKKPSAAVSQTENSERSPDRKLVDKVCLISISQTEIRTALLFTAFNDFFLRLSINNFSA